MFFLKNKAPRIVSVNKGNFDLPNLLSESVNTFYWHSKLNHNVKFNH